MQGPLSQIQGQPGYREDKKALKSGINLSCTSYCFNFGFHLLFEAGSYAAKAVRELPIKPPASTSEWYDGRAPPSSVLLA